MLGIARALEAGGMAKERIKFELFASGQPGRAKRPAASRAETAGARTRVTLTLDGATRRLEVDKGTSILDAALENAIDAPFACKAGVCSTCRCKVLDGEAEMAANHALEDYEVAQGYILSCQSFALTDTITVDYDQ